MWLRMAMHAVKKINKKYNDPSLKAKETNGVYNSTTQGDDQENLS